LIGGDRVETASAPDPTPIDSIDSIDSLGPQHQTERVWGVDEGAPTPEKGAPSHAAHVAEPLQVYPSLLGAGYAACVDPAPHGESHALEDDLPQRSRHTATKPLAARLTAECFLIIVFAVAADPLPLFTCLFFSCLTHGRIP
jgi:hypothetical protein